MRNLGRLIVQTSTGMVSYGRVMEIISQDARAADRGHASTGRRRAAGEIGLRGRQLRVRGERRPVLQDISFQLPSRGRRWRCSARPARARPALVNLLPRFYEYTERQHHAGRRGAEGVSARVPAQPDRHRRAGAVPVLAHHPREHHLRRGAGRARGRGRGGGRGRRHPRRDPELPGRLRHAGRREGRDALGRAEAARGHRPHAAQRTRAS